jgi:hypothetical protein
MYPYTAPPFKTVACSTKRAIARRGNKKVKNICAWYSFEAGKDDCATWVPYFLYIHNCAEPKRKSNPAVMVTETVSMKHCEVPWFTQISSSVIFGGQYLILFPVKHWIKFCYQCYKKLQYGRIWFNFDVQFTASSAICSKEINVITMIGSLHKK